MGAEPTMAAAGWPLQVAALLAIAAIAVSHPLPADGDALFGDANDPKENSAAANDPKENSAAASDPKEKSAAATAAANRGFLEKETKAVGDIGGCIQHMKSDIDAVYTGMSGLRAAAAKAASGEIHLTSSGIHNALAAVKNAESKERSVDGDGASIVKQIDSVLEHLRRHGAVASAEQPPKRVDLSPDLVSLDAESREASAMVDALTDVSKKLKEGLHKHDEELLSAKMEQQVQALKAHGEHLQRQMGDISSEAKQVMQIEKVAMETELSNYITNYECYGFDEPSRVEHHH